MYDVQVLMDKISGFETPDEIADLLREHDVKGCREKSRQCALAQMFRKTTNATYAAFGLVGSSISTTEGYDDTNDDFLGELVNYDNTDAMQIFIHHFDGGNYPDLECSHAYHGDSEL